MNTPYPSSTSSMHSLCVGSGMRRLQRVIVSVLRALVTDRERGLQPPRLANLRFPLFTRDDQARPREREKPTHDDHLPPPC
jgi:hypothetical protein